MQNAKTKQIRASYAFRRSFCFENKGRMDKKRNFVFICDEFCVTDFFFEVLGRALCGCPSLFTRSFYGCLAGFADQSRMPSTIFFPLLLLRHADILSYIVTFTLAISLLSNDEPAAWFGLFRAFGFKPTLIDQASSCFKFFCVKNTCGSSNADVIPCGCG